MNVTVVWFETMQHESVVNVPDAVAIDGWRAHEDKVRDALLPIVSPDAVGFEIRQIDRLDGEVLRA